MAYADVEIRILKQDKDCYPVEITVDSEREFLGGVLHVAGQPPPRDAHYIDDEYGQKLFDWFFADPQLKDHWAQIRGAHPQRRVRLRIDADAPALHQVVWEALCEPAEVLRLASASATPFSRYLAAKAPPGKPVLRRPIRVLVVAPAQSDFTPAWRSSSPKRNSRRWETRSSH
jgi:hypothetical protein